MKIIAILAVLIAAAQAIDKAALIGKQWDLFKARYKKIYSTPEEESKRFATFLRNNDEVLDHNIKFANGEKTYSMGLNPFSDMTDREVHDHIINTKLGNTTDEFLLKGKAEVIRDGGGLDKGPISINWVRKGHVTPVVNQDSCQSAYAIAAVGAVESNYHIKVDPRSTKKIQPLSIQNIIDCSFGWENSGCSGGYVSRAFDYIQENGINDANEYPYLGEELKECKFNDNSKAIKIQTYKTCAKNSEQLLYQMIRQGPVAVLVNARPPSFAKYKGGVYSDNDCSANKPNHPMLLVGYGTEPQTGEEYWLLKNSWGIYWGEGGYMKLARNKNNMCGIAYSALLPIIRKK